MPVEPEPEELVRTLPTVVGPMTVGTAGAEGVMPLMKAVGVVDVAEIEPTHEPVEFVAVTIECTYKPTSAEASVYVFAVALPMVEQPPPDDVQRCHWYVYIGVGMPVHVPLSVVRTLPVVVVPVTFGRAVFAGVVPAT